MSKILLAQIIATTCVTVLCLYFTAAVYIGSSLYVDGKQCQYVQVNWRFRIDAWGCK
jgi:hypothetical protein